MSVYAIAVLVLGAVAAYIGLENLFLFLFFSGGRRLHLWVGLLGLADGLYCCFTCGLYSAHDPLQGGRWQRWQLAASALMIDLVILVGLEFLERLRRGHVYALVVPTAVLVGSMWVPGLGLTATPAVKQLRWPGIAYQELSLGPAPQAFFVVGAVWMGYVAALLLRQARRRGRQERLMLGVFLLWYVAAINDMLVSAGLLRSVYLVEYSFFVVVVVLASILSGVERRTGQRAERERRQLSLEVMARDRDLAQAQAELTEAAKLAAVGRLAAGVAHEVNNPLTYVVGNLQLLERELREDEELLTLTREALHGARRIQKVARQLSTFARTEPGAPPGRVAVAVDSAAKMSAVELRDRATLQLDVPVLPAVAIDEEHLAQVLLNLLINAAQSIPPGRRDENQVRMQGRALDELVEIVVEDSGSGIPPDALPHVFEPFFTTKEVGQGQGQGLGLSISRTLVRNAGGEILAENLADNGARFTVRLPIYRGEPRFAADSGRSPSVDGTPDSPPAIRQRLLLVDDDLDVLQSLRRNLERLYVVQTATGGAAALRAIAAQRFDIILCDLLMPEGSGIDVLEGLRRDHPQLVGRLILMTGNAPSAEREALRRLPTVPLLEKPFGLAELRRAVEGIGPALSYAQPV